MAPATVNAPGTAYGSVSYVQWTAVVAGALSAAALAFVLHAFATSIGLSVSSVAPTWRDASIALVLLSGFYLVLVAVASYGVGGYVAGRLSARYGDTSIAAEQRDGVHGLLVWAMATIMTGLLAFAAAQMTPRLAAPNGGPSGAATSLGSENIIAFDIDRLFRSERPMQGDINYTRAEAGRILLTASSHRGVQPDDRAHLVRMVASRAGLAPPEAERRVDTVIGSAKQNMERARRSAVMLAFMSGAAALLGAAVAFHAAWAAGRHRDGVGATPPTWRLWGPPSPSPT